MKQPGVKETQYPAGDRPFIFVKTAPQGLYVMLKVMPGA